MTISSMAAIPGSLMEQHKQPLGSERKEVCGADDDEADGSPEKVIAVATKKGEKGTYQSIWPSNGSHESPHIRYLSCLQNLRAGRRILFQHPQFTFIFIPDPFKLSPFIHTATRYP